MNDIILPPSGLSVAEKVALAKVTTVEHAGERVRYALTMGAILSALRADCESPACDIEGDNPNIRFSKVVSDIVSETPGDLLNVRQAHRYRSLYEAFGHLPVAEVTRIGLTHGYQLALAPVEVREQVIEFVQAGNRLTASEMRRITEQARQPIPAARAAQVAEDAVIIESQPVAAPEPVTPPAGELAALWRRPRYGDMAYLISPEREAEMDGWTVDSFGFPDEAYDLDSGDEQGELNIAETEWLRHTVRRLAAENDELRAEISRLKDRRG
ncbi:hypothetical protein ACEUZ9_002697 [Paracoccus litorisediminis]|uniref:hypothetical protein n=1 Tax=Paracoccus litorisediminis TaxID=2006130 RepID=UPI003731CB90